MPILGQYNSISIFFTYYFAEPRPTLDHYQEDSLTKLMLITYVCVNFRLEGRRQPSNEVESVSPAGLLG